MSISGETILITGASSGLGMELAKTLSANNVIIACARRAERLEQLQQHSPNIHLFIFDVTDSDRLPERTNQLKALVGHLDRVIMNAGDCIYTSTEDCSINDYSAMMNVNFFGWIHTLSVTLELLKKSKKPHLIGISSQVIHAPFPLAGAYGASKAAASYFLSTARIDLSQFNISVSVIHPGFVDTPLTQRNNFAMPTLMSVTDASKRILWAIQKRKLTYSFPQRLRLMLTLSRLFPRIWAKKLSNNHT